MAWLIINLVCYLLGVLLVWFVIDFFSSLACYWYPVHVDHPRNKVLLKNSAADEFIAECIFACDQPSGADKSNPISIQQKRQIFNKLRKIT